MRIKFILLIVITGCCSSGFAQSQEAQQLLLNYTKLVQMREILDNMYKGYKILSGGYNTIKDISQGNFNLHKLFLDGLFAINPSVAKYKRIPDIILKQKLIIKAYKRGRDRIAADGELSVKEVAYIERVYGGVIQQSLRNLDELITIVTATKLRMSDDERLKAIDRLDKEMERKLTFLRYFNDNTHQLAVQRAKDKSELDNIKKLHTIK